MTQALLPELLRCRKCGSRFVAASKLAYCCSSYKNGGASACDEGRYFNRAGAETAIVSHLRKFLGTPAAIEAAQAAYLAAMTVSLTTGNRPANAWSSDYAEEAQATVRELLGGQGTVYERDDVIGAEFEVASFLPRCAAKMSKLVAGARYNSTHGSE